MYILAIESTAHTLGCSIVKFDDVRDLDKFKSTINILSNVRRSFTTEKDGMIPAKVADHHVNYIWEVIEDALNTAGISLNQIDLVGVAQGPGIGHTLRIGVFASRVLSRLLEVPVIPVNHCIAHLEIGRLLTKAVDPILLYVSGANTQVIAYEANKYRVFGETLDIGVGNFLDSFARTLGLGFPGGPKIYDLALKGKNFIEMPYSVKGMDISLGGLLTWLKTNKDNYDINDLCFSVQETVFAMLLEVAERAMAHTGKNELILGGGVACNLRLQEMAKKMVEQRDGKIYFLENQFYVDNAAMIALTAVLKWIFADDKTKELFVSNNLFMKPYERTDDVSVYWR